MTPAEREFLIVAATRYTLGRQSYAVGEMANIIREQAQHLSRNTLEVLSRDIRGQEYDGYGMECDRLNWMGALTAIELVLSKFAAHRAAGEK